MGQVLTPEQMPDAVIATINHMHKGKWIGQMTDLQEHVGMRKMVKEKYETVGGGRNFTVRYVTDHNHSAQHVGLFNTMDFSRDDAMVEGQVPWTYTDGNMVFDEREEGLNSGPEKVVDLVKTEYARMMTSIAELCEQDVWGTPATSADNDIPYGVEYWVQKNSALGFNGGNPAGHAAGRAGISSLTYTRHKNFTGAYTSVDDVENTGLIYMMEQAADKTRWVAPTPEPGMGRSGYGTRGIYSNWETKNKMKNVAKANNDSLGFDLSTQTPVFRNAPIEYVPYFDDKSDNPVYMLDHNHLYAKFLKGWHMKHIKVQRTLPNQPHCFAVIVSSVWNICCDDLRRQAVFYDAN